MKAVKTVWEVRTYDVNGDLSVNDTFLIGEFDVAVKPTVNNAGTPHEFYSASLTDRQIRRLLGVRYAITTDGDGEHITVDRARDGFPVGELYCTSHRSLSWNRGEDGPPLA